MNQNKFYEKYIKYKDKYLKLKKTKKGGDKNVLLLNKSKYIDTLGLNNSNVYTTLINNINIDVILFDTTTVVYRGFNRPCNELNIYPGSPLNLYNNEPIWFSGPEVVIVYCAMNINTSMLKRYYFNLLTKTDSINIKEMVRLYETLLLDNLSSILAYSPSEKVELIDVNNIENLKNIILLFNDNYSKKNYLLLNGLGRIPERVIKNINEQLKKIRVYNKYIKIENDNNIDDKDKIFYNKMGTIMEWGFRKAFSFGKYDIYNDKKKKFYPRKETKQQEVTIHKYKGSVQNSKSSLYFNVGDINELREKKQQLLNKVTEEKLYDDINLTNKKYTKIYDKFIDKMKEKIKKKSDELKIIAKLRKKEIRESYLKDRNEAYLTILDIKNKKVDGYNVDLGNDSLIGFKKVDNTSDTYKVYFYYNFEEKKYTNPSSMIMNNPEITKNMKNCKLCRLARTSDWINEKHKDTLSHANGLSNNVTYYDYNPITDEVDSVGSCFQQLYGKNMDYDGEERVLAIPFNHIGTMGHHPDCSFGSKTFPPNGSYHPKEKINNCGANVYANSKNAEIIYNLLCTYKTALTYAYLKTGKEHKIAELNYDHNSSQFYKFKNSINSGPAEIYLFFHTKANSEPHLHMHTILDSNGTHLKNINNYSRILVSGMEIKNDDILEDNNINLENFVNFGNDDDENKNNDDDDYENKNNDNDDNKNNDNGSNKNKKGGGLSTEIYGSDEYDTYENCPEKKRYHTKDKAKFKFIKCEGKRKKDEDSSDVKWENRKEWSDMFGVSSSLYDDSYKYNISGSFEFLFKSILGFKNSTDSEIRKRMSHKYIFSKPTYEIHKDQLFEEHKLFDDEIIKYTSLFLKIKAEKTSIKIYPNIVYTDYVETANEIATPSFNLIKTKYGDISDDAHIIRNSTTTNDSIAMLFMQIALIENPKIGGYYGHSSPLLNSWKNITHTEIGLFNSIDYPLKFVKNAKYSTCNHDKNYDKKNFKKEILYAVYLNMIYNSESQSAFSKTKDPNIYVERDIINDFMNSDLQIMNGGRNEVNDIINESKYGEMNNINIKNMNNMNDMKKQILEKIKPENNDKSSTIGNIKLSEELKKIKPVKNDKSQTIENINLLEEIKKIKELNEEYTEKKNTDVITSLYNLSVNNFNKYFSDYKIDGKDIVVKNVFHSIYYQMVPNSGQIEHLQKKEIIKEC